MAISSDTRKRWAFITALRGVLLLLVGAYAVIFPGQAALIVVLLGGAMLLVDGALGMWSLTFGGAKTGNFWFDVVHNVLAILTGALVLVSPLVATVLTAAILVYIVGFQAIVVGVMEVWVIFREREHYTKIWPVLLSGLAYVVFGLAVLFFPLIGARVLVAVAGVLAIVFAIGLFGLAWRMYRSSRQQA